MKRKREIVDNDSSSTCSNTQPNKRRGYRFILPGPEPGTVPNPLNEPSAHTSTFSAVSRGGHPRPIHDQLDDPSLQIRLLAAVPASRSGELAFRISTFWLADTSDFHAISYTWGDESNQRTIIINEQEHHVNQNCFYALWQASLHYSNICIWIDSVCINQKCIIEKNAQVRVMAEIYSKAARVLACVGPHVDNSAWLITMAGYLERLAQLTGCDERTAESYYDKQAVLWDLLKQSFSRETREQLLIAYRKFQHRMYWKRLWIQQEIALATAVDVLCGESKLRWQTFVLLNREDFWADYGGPEKERFGGRAQRPLKLKPNADNYTDFWLLLLESGQFECKDLRDRVYGLLGFLEPWYRNRLPPDYTLSVIGLARQIASMVTFHQAISAVKAFKTDQKGTDIVADIRKECIVEAPLDHNAPTAAGGCSCYREHKQRARRLKSAGIDIPVAEHFYFGMLSTLRANSRDQLTADLKHSSSLRKDVHTIKTRPQRLKTKQIMVNDEVAGFLCPSAREGDLLVTTLHMKEQNLIVLRPVNGKFYDLIGRGFLVNGYFLGLRMRGPYNDGSTAPCPPKYRMQEVEICINVSADEALAFWAAEVAEEESLGDRLAALHCPVTAHLHGASQVKTGKAKWALSRTQNALRHDRKQKRASTASNINFSYYL